MKKLQGKGVYRGIAIGELRYYRKEGIRTDQHTVTNVENELFRFRQAQKKELEELDRLYEKARKEVGEKDARIFQIHRMMLEDEEFIRSVENAVRNQNVNVEYAVRKAAETVEKTLASMEDDYLRSRSADIKEVFGSLIGYLNGTDGTELRLEYPVILAADDLSPSETIKLDKSKILAFVTAQGSSNSHTAILARSMNIPAAVALGDMLEAGCEGKSAVLDGETGTLYIEPDAEILETYRLKKQQQEEEAGELEKLQGQNNVTRDGRTVRIYANVGNLGDVKRALENDAGGIGLFRSEFLYLGRESLPTEEEQFQIYKTALENMHGKEVVIRTLDIGADKQADYLDLPKEQNPAMGCRAIRLCLTHPEIFKTQLRALYRASIYGKLLIMLPMITSVQEIRGCRRISDGVKAELLARNVPFDPDVPLGIMVETPAAAIISGELAEEADFFSIGTNDLTQYTLAMDRQNADLERFFNPHHPAVLQLIRTVAENAHRHGIWVGICGELGADEELTELFLNMGIDELSVSPSCILPLRKCVRSLRKMGDFQHQDFGPA